jgi:hypothetical membrane protein
MTNKQYAMAGLLAPAVFAITYFIMAGRRPEYSFMTKAISELGSLDAPNKWIWNVFGYIVPGLLISVFSIGLHQHITGGKGSKVPLAGIFLSGVFMAISGIFPGDFDNKASSSMLLHTLGSFGSYASFLLGAFTYPKEMRKNAYWKGAVLPGLLFTWLSIAFGSWPFLFPHMPALGQRLVFVCYFLWVAFYAKRMSNTSFIWK